MGIKNTVETSYQLLKVHPHQQRENCDETFYCLAEIIETSSVDEAFSESFSVSIILSLFVPPKVKLCRGKGVIENLSFDVKLSRYNDESYRKETLDFYIDTSWAQDRGLGKYMIIKIFNLLKSKVNHDFVDGLFFTLSENQGKDKNERMLRNHFYKSIGCTLEGHEDNPDAWNTVEGAKALINFDSLPESWNKEKVEEVCLNEEVSKFFSERNQLVHIIEELKSSLESHKKKIATSQNKLAQNKRMQFWAVIIIFGAILVPVFWLTK
ncbi:hypothetical protein [Pseudoalteromonas sp. SWYJZ19]|uniref:hypothetical protein n=1 Tax=Pseudoalteromonas sp. SWYJZ19 TaxID=2792068 RepID=UPI0018CE18F1|nr:hypothetical protein [Pseudoalteromonas sp. SWYJZ19]MBH0050674.1 hypothetical protein [Pseudoalteromonas sp. SWYJZ19]